MVDICMEAGLNFFDTADVYSDGASEEVLGQAIKHLKREDVLLSTKATFRRGKGPNDVGSSRYHLIQALEGSLKRLGTDYIDVYHLHAFDATTPVEETLNTLDKMVREGKVRYIACSNFSGWHLMKSLSVSERYGWAKYVGHQVYYSLVGREYEWELMPLAADQGVGALVWSPLGWGRLTGKIRRGQPLPETSRLQSKMNTDAGPQVPEEYLYKVVDALDEVAAETGKTVPQIALNWLLRKPTVSTLVIGARTEQQLQAEPRRGGLGADAGAGGEARCRQRAAARVSVLAPGAVRRAESVPGAAEARLTHSQHPTNKRSSRERQHRVPISTARSHRAEGWCYRRTETSLMQAG